MGWMRDFGALPEDKAELPEDVWAWISPYIAPEPAPPPVARMVDEDEPVARPVVTMPSPAAAPAFG